MIPRAPSGGASPATLRPPWTTSRTSWPPDSAPSISRGPSSGRCSAASAPGWSVTAMRSRRCRTRPRAWPPPGEPPLADRLLLLAGGPECRREFFGMAALARRCPSVTSSCRSPSSGAGRAGESWAAMWSALLGSRHRVADAPEPERTCSAVAELWSGAGGRGAEEGHRGPVEVRRNGARRRRGGGPSRIGLRQHRRGAARGGRRPRAPRARLLTRAESRSPTWSGRRRAPLETRVQLALADFYAGGCRLEGLLALWPLLAALNLVRVPPAAAREGLRRAVRRLAVPRARAPRRALGLRQTRRGARSGGCWRSCCRRGPRG